MCPLLYVQVEKLKCDLGVVLFSHCFFCHLQDSYRFWGQLWLGPWDLDPPARVLWSDSLPPHPSRPSRWIFDSQQLMVNLRRTGNSWVSMTEPSYPPNPVIITFAPDRWRDPSPLGWDCVSIRTICPYPVFLWVEWRDYESLALGIYTFPIDIIFYTIPLWLWLSFSFIFWLGLSMTWCGGCDVWIVTVLVQILG